MRRSALGAFACVVPRTNFFDLDQGSKKVSSLGK